MVNATCLAHWLAVAGFPLSTPRKAPSTMDPFERPAIGGRTRVTGTGLFFPYPPKTLRLWMMGSAITSATLIRPSSPNAAAGALQAARGCGELLSTEARPSHLKNRTTSTFHTESLLCGEGVGLLTRKWDHVGGPSCEDVERHAWTCAYRPVSCSWAFGISVCCQYST